MQPHKHQRDAIDSIPAYFMEKDGNPLVVMPTGTGKSVVIGFFLKEAFLTWPDMRVLVLTHVSELIEQNYAALLRIWSDAPAGIFSASLNRRDIDAPILFAGIQSIHRRAYDVQRCDLVLIDEAHLLSNSDTGMYRRFLKDLQVINPYLKVIGLTATPFRPVQGMLTEGKDRLFTDIAFDLPMLKMIEEGYLSPLIPKATHTAFDLSKVRIKAGDFVAADLEDAVNIQSVTEAAVDEIVRMGENRGSWLIFCSGVSHAEHVRDAVQKWGIACGCITGETPAPERKQLIRSFREGKLRALTNMNVLTTGFDAPGVDLIAMMRPTQSIGLYVQMLGRGTRTAPGKEDCLVMDFAENTRRHGPVDAVRSRVKKKGSSETGEFPAKTCPKCQTILHASVLICTECGHQFPPPERGDVAIARVADTAPVLSTQIKSEWIDVTGVAYSKHEKADKPTSLCVEYSTGFVKHREWVCFEHKGYPREKAVAWWLKRMPGVPIPSTIAAALAQAEAIPRPAAICVRPVGKYTEITSVRFA